MQLSTFFSNLKVLELSSVLAGPLAGSFFSELGAKVTKVENKISGGDITRQWLLPEEDPRKKAGAYYYAANYNKDVVFLDFNQKEDMDILTSFVQSHDVIITNFQKKVAQKYKLEPHTLYEDYPEKIIVQLNAYDYEDPRPGFDLIMQAETGFISMNGTESGELCKMPVAMIDIMASHQIKEAVLIALLQRQMSGKGSLIHVSLYQSGVASLANQASNYLTAGKIAKPMGTLHPNIAPYGDLFFSSDGHTFFLGVGSDVQFQKLRKTLNFSEKDYVIFANNSNRLQNRTELQILLQSVFTRKTMMELELCFLSSGIPFAGIKNIKEVFENALSKKMIKDQTENGEVFYSVSNIAFTIDSL
jgi:crotonobetainyl-CoA:carnitine CoA-transferase CaiB-like acyl-CoA transferase